MKPNLILPAVVGLALCGCCYDCPKSGERKPWWFTIEYHQKFSIHRHGQNERPPKAVPDDPSCTRYFLSDGTEIFPFKEKGTK